MDSPIKDRMTASVALKNKFAAFCSDDEGDASEIVTKIAPIKKVEKPSAVKKAPHTATTTTSTSSSKNHPNLEKSQTVTANKEATRGRGGNDREGNQRRGGTTRDGAQRRGGVNRDGNQRQEGSTRDGTRREGVTRDGNQRREGGATREGTKTRAPRRDENRRQVRTEGGERSNDENRRPRPQPREGENVPINEGEEKANVDRRPNRGDRGTGRPYRGGARGSDRGGPRGNVRSDRTGVHDAPKKDGHGKGNWGTEQDELRGETEPIGETNVEKPTHEDNADKNDSGVELEKEDEKPIGMTLNEWKEKNKIVEPETFNIRKPNDDKKLNLAPLKKSEENDKENEEFVVLRREPREKHVDISFNFASTDNGSGGNRGNRDGFRGRGRGGDRSDRGDRIGRQAPRGTNRPVHTTRGGDKSQFNLVNDQFPALGGH